MGNKLKILGFTLITVVLLLAAGIIALVTLVDPNDYKKEIAEAVQQYTGRTIEFTGDLKLTFFPWLGLEAGALRIGNPEAFGGGDFMSLESAGLHIKLLPLMEKDVQVSSITLNGVTLNLVRNAKGQVNWDFTSQASPSTSPQPGTTAPLDQDGMSDSTVASPLAALLVESIAVNKAAITYTDMQTNSRIALNDLNLTTTAIRMGKPVDITLTSDVTANSPQIDANIDLKVSLLVAHDFSRIDLDNMNLVLDAKGASLPGGSLALHQQGAFAYDLMQQNAAIKSFSLSAYDTDITASGTVDLNTGNTFNGKIALQSKLRKTLTALGITVSTTDPKVLENGQISFDIAASPAQVTLNNIKGTLDDTNFSGNVGMQQFNRPSITAALNLTTLNVDRYLPPENTAQGTGGSPSPQTAPAPKQTPAPVTESGIPAETKKALRSLLLDASLKVGSLTVKQVTLTDMIVKATAKDGLFRITPCTANLFEGRYDADITADLRGAKTKSAVELVIKNIKLAPLTTAFTGQRQADGTANFQTNLTAAGETWPDISGTLDGAGAFAVTDGAVYGFQIIPDSAKSQLQGSKVDKADNASRKQTFDRLTGTYVARAGRITNNDLALVSPNLNAAGAGYVDLRRDKIDYKATIRVTGLPPLPVTVTGTLANPRYGLDAGAFLQNSLKGVENLLPIPGIFGGSSGGSGSDGNTNNKQDNPVEQLGKSLQLLFK